MDRKGDLMQEVTIITCLQTLLDFTTPGGLILAIEEALAAMV